MSIDEVFGMAAWCMACGNWHGMACMYDVSGVEHSEETKCGAIQSEKKLYFKKLATYIPLKLKLTCY